MHLDFIPTFISSLKKEKIKIREFFSLKEKKKIERLFMEPQNSYRLVKAVWRFVG